MKKETLTTILSICLWALPILYLAFILCLATMIFMAELSWDQAIAGVGLVIVIGYLIHALFSDIRRDIERNEKQQKESEERDE